MSAFAVRIVLRKYILLCPETYPVVDYFANEVEGELLTFFSGRLAALQKIAHSLSDKPAPNLKVNYDLSMKSDKLPWFPIVILFNDREEAFPAQYALLLKKRAEHYLDAGCLPMLGRHLFENLHTNTYTIKPSS